MKREARKLRIILGLIASLFFGGILVTHAQKPTVWVAPVEGVIDLGLAPFLQRVLNEATNAGAKALVLEINTFGGRVDAAVLIRDALLDSKIQTVAFINKRAISAGALISLAAEKIAMADGGTIGGSYTGTNRDAGDACPTRRRKNGILHA